MAILITGAAGFIGSSLARTLIWQGQDIIGIDNFNEYYSRKCKNFNLDLTRLSANQKAEQTTDLEIHQVLSKLKEYHDLDNPNTENNPGNFHFYEIDICDFEKLQELFSKHKITAIVHLAAWAGVPLSTKKPRTYTRVNVDGTTNLLKLASDHGTKKFLFASSSSVYGHRGVEKVKETDDVTKTQSVYGATKVAGEVLCHAFNKSHNLKSAVIRIFGPIYGPLQRPYGMLHQRALNYLHNGKTLQIYGRNGLDTAKDATYIEDEIQGIIQILNSNFQFEIYNIGTANPLTIKHWIDCIEQAYGRKLNINLGEVDVADVTSSADITKAREEVGYEPKKSMEEGVRRQVEVFKLMPKWYQEMQDV